MAESDEGSDSLIGGMLKRVPGTTRIFQENDKVGVETGLTLADDDLMPSPIASSVRDARESLDEDEHDTVFDLYDALVDLDAELSGAVNAIAQSATFNRIVLPKDEPSQVEQEILEEVKRLNNRIRGREIAIDVLRNLIKYGNDVNKKVYNADDGIIAIQSLPINSITIVDDREDLNTTGLPSGDLDDFEFLFQVHPELEDGDEELGGEFLREAFQRDAYVLNEQSEKEARVIEPWNVLHYSIDSRSNWFEDYTGRQTYGVWGQSRLEALKFTIQTKYNTLINKVAMDDSLVAREIYYIDTAELFGDIQEREERIKKAETYADQLKDMIEDLGPDERPMLPEHVSVEVIGPEGKAIDQQPFIEQLNNAVAAALTFPMAGLGRGTTAVKAGEEISSLWAENNIKNLRGAVIRGFEEIFEDHIKLLHPELVVNHAEAEHLGEMELDPEITLPTLEYEPFRQENRSEVATQIETLVDIGVLSRREAREMWGAPTDDESMEELAREWNEFNSGGSLPFGEEPPDDGGGPPDDDGDEPSNEEENDEETEENGDETVND